MYMCYLETESTSNILKPYLLFNNKRWKIPKSCYKINIALIRKLSKYSTRKKTVEQFH